MPSSAEAPFPVIVGAPRSGTTLLRLMLDSHSQVAIPPETGFIPGLLELPVRRLHRVDDFVRWVTSYPSNAPGWKDFGIPEETFRRELRALRRFTTPDGVRTFYRLYARRFGKSRSGDKTPKYGLQMSDVERVLPEARFVHLIRDGRDVALSWRETWFSPGDDLGTVARAWRTWIEKTQAGSRDVAHYIEIRYERLVSEPELVLRDVASFVDLPYERGMLDYHLRSVERLEEHGERLDRDGHVLVSRERRLDQSRTTMRPLDETRAFAWRSAMSASERREFGDEAGPLLVALGYES